MQLRRVGVRVQVNRQTHLQHFALYRYEGPVSRPRFHGTKPSKAAKGRDQRSSLTDEEAGKRFPLQSATEESNAGMNVAGQPIGITSGHWLMAEDKGRHERRGIDAVDPQVAGRIAGVPVVVSPNQQDLDGSSQAAPAAQLSQRMRGDPSRFGVEEVAQNHHASRTGAGERAVQPSQVVAGSANRDGDPRGPKGGSFTPMEIGYDQGACVGPPERALGQEIDLFASDLQQHIGHRNPLPRPRANRALTFPAAAARSSGAASRRSRSRNFSLLTCSRARSTSSANASGVGRRHSLMLMRPRAIRSSVRPNRLRSSCFSNTSRWAWNSRRLSGS